MKQFIVWYWFDLYCYFFTLVKVTDFPHLKFTINGGFATIKQAKETLDQHKVWGVMIGRAATNDPSLFRNVDKEVFGLESHLMPTEVVKYYLDYCKDRINCGENAPLHLLLGPMLNLFNGVNGSKEWKKNNCSTSSNQNAVE